MVFPLGTSRRALATMQPRERRMSQSPTQRAHFPVHMARVRRAAASESELQVPGSRKTVWSGAKVTAEVLQTEAGRI